MMRRVACPTLLTAVSRNVTTAQCGFHGSAVALGPQSPPGGSGGNPYSADDRAEEERERKLREQFAQKIMNTRIHQQQIRHVREARNPWQMFKALNEVARQQRAQQQQQSQGGAGQGPFDQQAKVVRSREVMYRFFFFFTSIYLLVLIYQFTDEQSRFNLMRGVPWWTQPIDSTACFLLLRHALSRTQQQRVMDDLHAAQRFNPTLTLAQLVQQTPTLLAGTRYTQNEAIATVIGAFAAAGDLRIATTMAQVVSSYSSSPESIDRIVDALRQAYPQSAFAPPPVAPQPLYNYGYGYAPVQQQGQMPPAPPS